MELKITDEILNSAIDLYNEGYNVVDIATKFNLKPNSLYSRLKLKGFSLEFRKKSKLYMDTFKEAKILHDSGQSFSQISKSLGISYSSLYNFFKKSNFEHIKGIDDLRSGKCIDNYFSSIDTKDKAYILGLIVSDGCVRKNPNILSLKLIEKDIKVLEFVRDSICIGKKLYKDVSKITRKDGSNIISYKFSVTSSKIVEDLDKLFITEKKTGKEKVPNIPEPLMRHFIRGVFDGDGSISVKKCVQASICCSNLQFLLDIKSIIGCGKVYTTSKNRNVPMHYISFRSKCDLSNFYTYLYGNGGYKMDRKFVIFNSWYLQHTNTEVNK